MLHKKLELPFFEKVKQFFNNKCVIKKGFTLAEGLIGLAIVAVIVVLLLPVVTTRAQNKSFAVTYETELKQMLNSLEGLPINENKDDIKQTMMYIENDTGNYSNNAGAYINKYMKVSKYCGDTPGDCFGSEYYEYKDNDKVTFDMKDIKGACAQLKNGVSICLKPQIKNNSGKDEIEGWIDLNGAKGPNIYGRDLRTFSINLKQRAVFSDEDPTTVIVPDPPKPCEGSDCGKVETDPCKINPFGKECCTRDGYEAVNAGDRCCIWYMDPSSGPNHLICNPKGEVCDPTKDPDCAVEECARHTITGPTDECCAVLSAKGIYDPNCCRESDTSDYCCAVHPETEGCCIHNVETNKIQLNPNSACCKNYQSIYNRYAACQSVCERNSNSKECCQTLSRRQEINNPDDTCCIYPEINGIDASAKNNQFNQYCCRLPKNNSRQCCAWKSTHLNYFATSADNELCCHDSNYGIKSKRNEIYSRCCTIDKAQENAEEDELCCDYLVAQNGDDKLKHGQSLRRCCKYTNHKNKPECCSHDTDGMASQTYNANVGWAAQCCMPNSIYNNNVTPNIQCCFVTEGIVGESGNLWKNNRLTSCCSYGDQTYNGKKANEQTQWQLNCCTQGIGKYPSVTAFNNSCCTNKSGNRFIWRDECCTSLIAQNPTNNTLDNWKQNCCSMPEHYDTNANYRTSCCTASTTDYTRNNNSTVQKEKEYCCHPDAANPAAECCKVYKTLAGNDDNWKDRDDNAISDAYKIACCAKSTSTENYCPNSCAIRWETSNTSMYDFSRCCADRAAQTNGGVVNRTKTVWKNNCCNYARTSYASASDYRSSCCSGEGVNKTGVTQEAKYCCSFANADSANATCCAAYKNNGWKTNDGTALALGHAFVKACCNLDSAYCQSCASRSYANSDRWNLPTCCNDNTMKSVHKNDAAWKQACCDYPTDYSSISAYRDGISGCCSLSADRTRTGTGNLSNNLDYCCIPNSVTAFNISSDGNGYTISGIIPL